MKKEMYYCDVCGRENGSPRTGDNNEYIQVIFTTEQNEGRTVNPYFELVKIDICEICRNIALSGKYIFATGAMGHNRYYFKD